MRLSISILIFAICSSLVFAQNEDASINSDIINVLEPTFKGTDIYRVAQMNKIKADDLMKEGKYNRALKLYTKALAACPMLTKLNDVTDYAKNELQLSSIDIR